MPLIRGWEHTQQNGIGIRRIPLENCIEAPDWISLLLLLLAYWAEKLYYLSSEDSISLTDYFRSIHSHHYYSFLSRMKDSNWLMTWRWRSLIIIHFPSLAKQNGGARILFIYTSRCFPSKALVVFAVVFFKSESESESESKSKPEPKFWEFLLWILNNNHIELSCFLTIH